MAVATVVAGNRIDRRDRLVMRRKIEQAVAQRVVTRASGTHRHYGAAAGEVTDGAVAEPPAIGACIDVLGHGELAARTGDKIPVARNIGGNRARIGEFPTMPLDLMADVIAGRPDRHPETGIRASTRQVEEFDEIDVLRPEIGRAPILDVLAAIVPARDRGEALGPVLKSLGRLGP